MVEVITALIAALPSVGFPIFVAIALGVVVWKMYIIQREDKDKYSEQLSKSQEATAAAIDTIKSYADKLDDISYDVKAIKSKIDIM